MKIILIVSTYNESENIRILIPALQQQFQTLPHDLHLLVVDDDSPDGTAGVVRQLMPLFPNVHLLEVKMAGSRRIYVRGIRHAIEALSADAVFQMNANLSDKPEDVPRLVAELEAGADFVIGSRYVTGASLPSEWGMLRRIKSKFDNLVSRYLAGLYDVRDCTTGFWAIRTSLLQRIDFAEIGYQGYAFQISLLQRAMAEDAVIREIPVDFTNRTPGESKLSLSEVIEFLFAAVSIRFQGSRTFVKYAIVGACGVVVNLGMFKLLLVGGVNKYLASPVAIEISIIWNFFLNNYWTFRWRKTAERTRVKGLKFHLVSLISLAVSYSSFAVLSLLDPQGPPTLHQLVGIVPATAVNYLMNSYWTFQNQPPDKPYAVDSNDNPDSTEMRPTTGRRNGEELKPDQRSKEG